MKRIKLLQIILLLMVLSSCSMFFSSNDDNMKKHTNSDSGSITISLSYMSQVLQDYFDSQSRALLYTNSALIEIQDSDGNDIVDPVTVNLSTSSSFENNSVEVTTINDIPSGTDYTVKISIYNSAVSTTEPIVTGSADPVTIFNNNTTNVSIVCLPENPITITADDGPWNYELAANEEKWYKVSFDPLINYTISQATTGIGTFLYDFQGKYIASINDVTPYTFECVTTAYGDYYIGVTSSSSGTSILNITSSIPEVYEGTITTPKIISIDTQRIFRIPRSDSSNGRSYYAFGTTEAGEYYLDYSLYNWGVIWGLSASLYSDSTFSNQLDTSFHYTTGLYYGWSLGTLDAYTTYYLELGSEFKNAFSGIISSPAYVESQGQNDGSIDSPAILSINTKNSCTVGTCSFDRISYYTFTTGSETNYDITLEGEESMLYPFDVSGGVYSDSDFTDQITNFDIIGCAYGNKYTFKETLAADTKYFIKVKNGFEFITSDTDQKFSILIES